MSDNAPSKWRLPYAIPVAALAYAGLEALRWLGAHRMGSRYELQPSLLVVSALLVVALFFFRNWVATGGD